MIPALFRLVRNRVRLPSLIIALKFNYEDGVIKLLERLEHVCVEYVRSFTCICCNPPNGPDRRSRSDSDSDPVHLRAPIRHRDASPLCRALKKDHTHTLGQIFLFHCFIRRVCLLWNACLFVATARQPWSDNFGRIPPSQGGWPSISQVDTQNKPSFIGRGGMWALITVSSPKSRLRCDHKHSRSGSPERVLGQICKPRSKRGNQRVVHTVRISGVRRESRCVNPDLAVSTRGVDGRPRHSGDASTSTSTLARTGLSPIQACKYKMRVVLRSTLEYSPTFASPSFRFTYPFFFAHVLKFFPWPPRFCLKLALPNQSSSLLETSPTFLTRSPSSLEAIRALGRRRFE